MRSTGGKTDTQSLTSADNLVRLPHLTGFEFHEIKRNDEGKRREHQRSQRDEQTASKQASAREEKGRKREGRLSLSVSWEIEPAAEEKSGAELGASFVASLE